MRQLPSGNWNTTIKIEGKQYSFTASTKRECQRKAEAFRYEQERKQRTGIDVATALSRYIDCKRNILSPTTLSNYTRIAESCFETIRTIPVSMITSADLQAAVNLEAGKKKQRGGAPVSAKSVKNAYSLLAAAIKLERPEFAPVVTLPKQIKTFRDLPDPKDVYEAVRGTDVELPVLFAMWLSLSMSEIRGIHTKSIQNNVLTIQEAVVQVDGQAVHKKATKAYDRTRRLQIPPYIMGLIEQTNAWKAGDGYIETRSGKAVTSRFQRVIRKAGLPHMRFHDLRHLFSSIAFSLGIPDRIAEEIGGWSGTSGVMEKVYQHTFSDDRKAAQTKIDQYFTGIISFTPRSPFDSQN